MSAVYVLGNASFDLTFATPRLPLPGETLMATGLVRAPGGKGLNQAVVAARAGVPVNFCAAVGREPEVVGLRARLAAEPFASLTLATRDPPTDVSVLVVGSDGENCIVSTGQCADALTMQDAASFLASISPDDVLLMQGNLTLDVTLAAATHARARGARVLVNTAPIRWDTASLIASCEILVANEIEAQAITDCETAETAAAWLLARGAPCVVVTLGARGCLVATRGGRARYDAPAVAPVDTSGAGDTFCGGLAAALAMNFPLAKAVFIAQRAAALTVTRAGCFDALPSRDELRALFAAAADAET